MHLELIEKQILMILRTFTLIKKQAIIFKKICNQTPSPRTEGDIRLIFGPNKAGLNSEIIPSEIFCLRKDKEHRFHYYFPHRWEWSEEFLPLLAQREMQTALYRDLNPGHPFPTITMTLRAPAV